MGFTPGTIHISEPKRPDIWRKAFALTNISESPDVCPDFILVIFVTSQKCRGWGLCRHLWGWLLRGGPSTEHYQVLHTHSFSGRADWVEMGQNRFSGTADTSAVLDNICNCSLFKWRAFTTPCGSRSSGRKFFIIRGTLKSFLNML